MLCYRCGGHVRDGSEKCSSCGQQFAAGLKPGPIAGFGAGSRRHRVAVEGAPFKVSELAFGRFLIKEHVGAGPLGWTYRAVESSSGIEVALKILSPRFLQMPEEKRAFSAEMARAKTLSHQNIARLYDAGEESDSPWMASQFLEGLSLRRIMELRRQKGQGFALHEVEPIVAQIAAGLDSANFAHGNLKPDNVLVLPDLLKLTDFGLSGSLPRAPFMAAQRAGGVHRYLAPGFMLGEPLGARSDVYSLGVMLGELLSGVAFHAQLDLRARDPALPASVQAIFRRAVAPHAHERFASAGDLAAELTALVEGLATSPQSPGEDDVIIEEARTDPRLRIARALAAQDAAEASRPATAARPAAQPGNEAPLAARANSHRAEQQALPQLQLKPSVQPPPFTPALYQPETPRPAPRAAEASRPAPLAAAAPAQAQERPPGSPPASLGEVASRLGSSAETQVRATPPETNHASEASEKAVPRGDFAEGSSRPRRGAGKRNKQEKRRGRRGAADPAWTTATEGALATGPATSALQPLRPETRPHEAAAVTEAQPISTPAAAARALEPAAYQQTSPAAGTTEAPQSGTSRPARAAVPAFGSLVEHKRRPSVPVVAAGALVIVLVLVAAFSWLHRKTAPAAEGSTDAVPAGAPAPVATAPVATAPVAAQAAAASTPAATPPAAARLKPAPAAPSGAPAARPSTAAPAAPAKAEPAKGGKVKKTLRQRLHDAKEKAKAALAERRARKAAAAEARKAAQDDALESAARRREESRKRKLAELNARSEPDPAPAAAAPINLPAPARNSAPARAELPVSGSRAVLPGSGGEAQGSEAAPGTPAAPSADPSASMGAISGLEDGDSLVVSKDPSVRRRAAEELSQAAGARTVATATSATMAAAAEGQGCPAGMQRVLAGPASIGSDATDDLRNFGDRALSTVQVQSYCIDRFEFPNTPGRLPKVASAFGEAEQSCSSAGKRLCSEEEWEKACKGPQALRFPYGQAFDADACNTQDQSENPRGLSLVGIFGRCKSGYGVFDMSGNAAEWTSSPFESGAAKTVKGGHSGRPGFDDRCASRRKLSPGQHDIKVGFRCCKGAR